MATGRVIRITKKSLMGYTIPSGTRVRSNPGVTAIMGVSNGRGAYRRAKIGGLALRKSPPSKYAKEGAVSQSHYAGPGYKYPIRTARRPNESVAQWHDRDRKFVKRALSRFGKNKHLYSPKVRATIASRIARASKIVGQDSPKAMDYRAVCGVKGKPKPGKACALANGGEMSLFFKRRTSKASRRNVRRNAGTVPGVGTPYRMPSTLRGMPHAETYTGTAQTGPSRAALEHRLQVLRAEHARLTGKAPAKSPKGSSKAALQRRLEKLRAENVKLRGKAPSGSKSELEKKLNALRAENARLTGKAAPPKPPRGSSKAELQKRLDKLRAENSRLKEKPMAKKKSTAASKKARAKGVADYWKKVKSGKIKRKGYKHTAKKATKKPAAAKKGTKKPAAAKKATKKPAAAKKATKKPAAAKAKTPAAKALSKYWAAVKRGSIKRKGYSTAHKGSIDKAKTAKKVRSNASTMTMPKGGVGSNMKFLVQPVLEGAGGFAVHRIGTSVLTKLLESIVSPTVARMTSAVAMAVAGTYAANKFLPQHAFNAAVGMGLSTFAIGVKEVMPGFAEYAGFSGVPTASLLPKYSMGEYLQAAAGNPFLQAAAGGGDPFLQAAAGEYFTTPQLGEYFSQDMFPVSGSEGSYAMSKVDVQGDTGAYEFHNQFEGVGATINEGISPNANMDSVFNFMEAAAGVGPADRSDYIPRERAIPAGYASTNEQEGIFDQGGIFA